MVPFFFLNKNYLAEVLRTWNKKISASLLLLSIIVGVFFYVQSVKSSEIDIQRSIYIGSAGLLFIFSLIDLISTKSSALKTGLLLATSILLITSCIEPSLFVRTWNYQLILLTSFLFFSLYRMSNYEPKLLTIFRALVYISIVGILLFKITNPMFYNLIFTMISLLTAGELAHLFLKKNQK